ncbi:hypothetical protein PR048_026041 [Dryococelus australis]|uniref:Uncharacterized protein n=1 Tax=Dryococelus australis TaxID=614101 RepID=A0ABQ9GK99_9NEOP|nr:hypothetical protein PR048_026041 [Dryococelus australis]
MELARACFEAPCRNLPGVILENLGKTETRLARSGFEPEAPECQYIVLPLCQLPQVPCWREKFLIGTEKGWNASMEQTEVLRKKTLATGNVNCETGQGGQIWAALNSEVLRADEAPECKSPGKREIPEKTRRPARFPRAKIPKMIPPGIEPRLVFLEGGYCSHCTIQTPPTRPHWFSTMFWLKNYRVLQLKLICIISQIWAVLNNEFLRAGMKRGEIPEKTRQAAASSGTILTCEDQGVAGPGIEIGSSWWEASRLTAKYDMAVRRLEDFLALGQVALIHRSKEFTAHKLEPFSGDARKSSGPSQTDDKCTRSATNLRCGGGGGADSSAFVLSDIRSPHRALAITKPSHAVLWGGHFARTQHEALLPYKSRLCLGEKHHFIFHTVVLIGCPRYSEHFRNQPQKRVAAPKGCSRLYKLLLYDCYQGNAGSIPGRVTPDFRMWESCRTMPLVGGFPRGSPVSPALSFQRCSVLT